MNQDILLRLAIECVMLQGSRVKAGESLGIHCIITFN